MFDEPIELSDIVKPDSPEFKEELRLEGHAIQQNLGAIKYCLDNYDIIELTDKVPRNSKNFYDEVRKEGFAVQPGLRHRYYKSIHHRIANHEVETKEILLRTVAYTEKQKTRLNERDYQSSMEYAYKKLYNPIRRLGHKISGRKKRAMKVLSRFVESSDSKIKELYGRLNGHRYFTNEPKCLRFSPARFILIRRQLYNHRTLNLAHI